MIDVTKNPITLVLDERLRYALQLDESTAERRPEDWMVMIGEAGAEVFRAFNCDHDENENPANTPDSAKANIIRAAARLAAAAIALIESAQRTERP